MTGSNKLQLCSKVLYDALSYYLNREVLREGHRVTVTNVVLENKPMSSGDSWLVTLEEGEAEVSK